MLCIFNIIIWYYQMHTCQVPFSICTTLEPVSDIDYQVLQIKTGHLQYMN